MSARFWSELDAKRCSEKSIVSQGRSWRRIWKRSVRKQRRIRANTWMCRMTDSLISSGGNENEQSRGGVGDKVNESQRGLLGRRPSRRAQDGPICALMNCAQYSEWQVLSAALADPLAVSTFTSSACDLSLPKLLFCTVLEGGDVTAQSFAS
ncbi:hypothetical protein LSTR_LSTR004981 [Laodelphax striatellus]|uniref:Uncharacterized protein n=1 Tax=Laodelphax striatellus TaxID=195883 RepID=A0A482XN69_LAOST|nr:hypothetical protein LSTR_LSTR004981 [Laodelphax striatellus]